MPKEYRDIFVNIGDFSGGVNNLLNPRFLQNQVADANGVVFDEIVGTASKIKGDTLFLEQELNAMPIRGISYEKESGAKYIVVCCKEDDSRFVIYYFKHGTNNWSKLTISGSDVVFSESVNFAVLDDILWMTNGIDIPVIFNGFQAKYLNGVGTDFYGYPLADFNFNTGIGNISGKFICVHKSCLFMANTINNGSEIIFSRFVDDDGNVIPSTASEAWKTSVNNILVDPANGSQITGIISYMGSLVVFKENGLYIIAGEIPNFSIIKLPTDKGTNFNDSIVVHNNTLNYLSNDGIYQFNGKEITCLSKNIQNYFSTMYGDSASLKKLSLSGYQKFSSGEYYNVRLTGTAYNSISAPHFFDYWDFRNFRTVLAHTENVASIDEGFVVEQLDQPTRTISTINSESHNLWDSYTNESKQVLDNLLTSTISGYQVGAREIHQKQDWYAPVRAKIHRLLKIEFPHDVFIKSITIKYWAKTSAWSYIFTRHDYIRMRKFKFMVPTSMGSLIDYWFEDYYYRSTWSDADSPVGSGSIVEVDAIKTIQINRSTKEIYLEMLNSSEIFQEGGHKKIQDPDVIARWIVDFIRIEYDNQYKTTGTVYTIWLDTEQLDNRNAGTFFMNSHTEIGKSNIFSYYALSDDNTIQITNESINWNYISHNQQLPSLPKRYIAFKFILVCLGVNRYYTPILRGFKHFINETGYWISNFDNVLGNISEWGKFFASYVLNNGNVEFYLSKDKFNWVRVYSGQKIDHILSKNDTLCYIKIVLTRGSSNAQIPVINTVSVTYLIGSRGLGEIVSGISHNNRAYWSIRKPDSNSIIPDRVVILNKTNVWSKFDDRYITSFIKFDKTLLGIRKVNNSYKLYELFNNDIRDFQSYIKTKTIIIGQPIEEFLIRNIWLFIDSSTKSKEQRVVLNIFPDDKQKISKTIVYKNGITNPQQINLGVKCREVFFEVLDAWQSEDFSIISLNVYTKLIRILSKYYGG